MTQAGDPFSTVKNADYKPSTPPPSIRYSLPIEDLGTDQILSSASRTSFENRSVPSLGGIPLLAKIGQGGMGAVYYGIHPRLKREVAVKVVPLHMAELQPDIVERFVREAQIAAQIQSPHLISVLDVNQEGNLYYLIMEFVLGMSAGEYLKQLKQTGKEGLDESVALDICIAATTGLSAAHAKGIVHRDIKPDNILIPQKNGTLLFTEAKLVDLGLARNNEIQGSLTSSRAVMGTPGYMSPEQACDMKKVGKASDIFSMGATLYGLLTGKAPFTRSSAIHTLLDTMQHPHLPIQHKRKDISEATAKLLDRCLDKLPENRPADAATLLEELKLCRIACDLPVEIRVPAKEKKGFKSVAFFLSLAGVIGMFIFGIFFNDKKEPVKQEQTKAPSKQVTNSTEKATAEWWWPFRTSKSEEAISLLEAADQGNEALVLKLLEQRANINETNFNGETPLILSVKKNYKNIAKILLDHRAKTYVKDLSGKTAMDWAKKLGDREMEELLKKAIAKESERSRSKIKKEEPRNKPSGIPKRDQVLGTKK